jgi:hypothetical protein
MVQPHLLYRTNILSGTSQSIIKKILTLQKNVTWVQRWARLKKKSVNWSDTDVILSEESINKAIVSLQIPEVLNDEAIQVLLWKKFWIGKAIVSFQTPEFFKVKRYRYFYAKNLNRQSDCIVSNPRIFKDETIQILLRQKIWIVKAIVSLQTAESFSDEAIHLLLILLPCLSMLEIKIFNMFVICCLVTLYSNSLLSGRASSYRGGRGPRR